MRIPDLSHAAWRKSSRSNGAGGECVEVAGMREAVAVRDSKDPSGPTLRIGRSSFRDLLARVRQGELDL
ncbi:DUF397 domain-containing protein [Actinomadura fibrosa]|uniref:DUF397 domain-containing protein n=1 Tax=Actinomadura fibrosa TaxID=111802 RepID=A0ABW2XK44_9ACTN|nr:DUF397 domain-containing protein [Actinomadura fibrosa]